MGTVTKELKQEIIGKTVAEAKALVEAAGCIFRVTVEDGLNYRITCEWRSNRVNVTVNAGKVVAIRGVG